MKENQSPTRNVESGSEVGGGLRSLVSIIIPCYNSQQFIGETLESASAQTYSNWECIIVDDGSTDKTEEIVRSHAAADSRFRLYTRPGDRTKGANACRNYGFEVSRGEYINWVDSDDIFFADKIEFQIGQLQKTDCEVSVCQASIFKDGDKTPFRKWRENIDSAHLTDDLISGAAGWHTSAPLWNRNVIPDFPFN